jgi:hypothetical protein
MRKKIKRKGFRSNDGGKKTEAPRILFRSSRGRVSASPDRFSEVVIVGLRDDQARPPSAMGRYLGESWKKLWRPAKKEKRHG